MIYAINKPTKEHKAYSALSDLPPAVLSENYNIIQADADGWIEFHGGNDPLPSNQLCEVKVQGEGVRGPKPTRVWAWDMSPGGRTIIAYRPILDDKPQAPEWNGEGLPPVRTVCEYRSGYAEQPYEYSKCTIIAHFIGESGAQLAAFTYKQHDGVVQVARGADSLFRPIRTERKKWVGRVAAMPIAGQSCIGNVAAAAIYDAIVCGDLPAPRG